MAAIPLVRASSLRPLVEFLERGGADLAPVRERAPVSGAPEMLLPIAYAGTLLEEAAYRSGLDDLGFHLGAATPIETFGEWGALLARAATLGAFLDLAVAVHGRFNTGYRLWWVTRGEEAWLHLRYSGSLRRGRAHAIEISLQLWLAALRHFLGPTWRPVELHLEGDPPRHAERIAALATRRVSFRQSSLAFGFPRTCLAARREPAPRAAAPRLASVSPATDFAGSARQSVASLLRLGALELAVAAEAAGMSERSFQRHLGQGGLTFSGLVDEARFEAARQLLADPRRRVIDISTELGYADSANFTRAFRRWSGVPPRLFRRAATAPTGGRAVL